MSAPPRPQDRFHVLLVDDSPVEALFLKDSLKACSGYAIAVRDVSSGEECLAYLRKEDRHAQAETPDLVIADFNLPGMNGADLVRNVAADPELGYLPILLMTSWDRQEDIDQIYGLRCNSYILKPTNLDELEKKMKVICAYWFSAVTLPTRR